MGIRASEASTIYGAPKAVATGASRAYFPHVCYGFGEVSSPNHKGWRISGGPHGNGTESDGAYLTEPQPYEGDKREFPRCAAGSL